MFFTILIVSVALFFSLFMWNGRWQANPAASAVTHQPAPVPTPVNAPAPPVPQRPLPRYRPPWPYSLLDLPQLHLFLSDHFQQEEILSLCYELHLHDLIDRAEEPTADWPRDLVRHLYLHRMTDRFLAAMGRRNRYLDLTPFTYLVMLEYLLPPGALTQLAALVNYPDELAVQYTETAPSHIRAIAFYTLQQHALENGRYDRILQFIQHQQPTATLSAFTASNSNDLIPLDLLLSHTLRPHALARLIAELGMTPPNDAGTPLAQATWLTHQCHRQRQTADLLAALPRYQTGFNAQPYLFLVIGEHFSSPAALQFLCDKVGELDSKTILLQQLGYRLYSRESAVLLRQARALQKAMETNGRFPDLLTIIQAICPRLNLTPFR